MTKNLLVLLFLCTTLTAVSQTKENTITGIVTDYGQPLPRVNISIKGTTEGIQTDDKGKYSIVARPRDVLVFSYVGMQTIEIIVEDVTKVLNIQMLPMITELDEVVVEQKKRETQEQLILDYGKNKNIIRTAYGYLDTENAGYAVNSIDGSELNPAAIDIVTALQAKLPGTRIIDNGTGSQSGGPSGKGILIRGGSSLNNPQPAIYEVDGTIFTSAPDFLIIDNIDRVAVLPGLAATTRYGNIASGGVIIINTKGTNVLREEGTNKPYDQARRRDNIYNENTVTSKFRRTIPNYMTELREAESMDAATAIYEKNRGLYGSSPYFYLNAADVFRDVHADTGKHLEIYEELKTKYVANSNALKALAYSLEEQNKLAEALALYVQIFKNRPSYSQSYRDLANMYSENTRYKKAVALYARYQTSRSLDTVTGEFEGIDAIIETELTHLLASRKEALAMEGNNAQVEDYGGIRVVFEWNNSEAEFDLQFVNPQNQYLVWGHTLENQKERITEEKMKGYTSEEFLIDKSLQGKWRVNIKYFGNKGYEPTYLKSTVYYDYGKPSQKKRVKVFQLSEVNVNSELFTIINTM